MEARTPRSIQSGSIRSVKREMVARTLDAFSAAAAGGAQAMAKDALIDAFRSGDFSLAGSTRIHSESIRLVKRRVEARMQNQ